MTKSFGKKALIFPVKGSTVGILQCSKYVSVTGNYLPKVRNKDTSEKLS